MTSTVDINSISVGAAMSHAEFCVAQTDKLDDVARIFQEKGCNSAPVIDGCGKCIGIITSSDLVRYQSQLADVNSKIDHGMSFEVTQREGDGSLELTQHPFDEVQRHMTTCLQTVEKNEPLTMASRIMCDQHIHHLIVLDESDRPAGILSSLDILAKLNG